MPHVIKLEIRAIRTRLGLNRAKFAEKVGMRADRIGELESNRFAQLSREELAKLFAVAAPAKLFTVYEPSIFYGAKQLGPLRIHLSLHSVGPAGENESLYVSAHDDEAARVLGNYARKEHIVVESVQEPPRSPRDRLATSIETQFPTGSAIVVGSQLKADLAELAICNMYEVTPFDARGRDRVPCHLVFDPRRAPPSSAFGYAAASPDSECGIYSQKARRIVARVTHVPAGTGGTGEDCAIVAAYRIPMGKSDEGTALERCVVVLCGMTGLSTLAAAKAVIDPALIEEFVPTYYWQPRMRVLKVSYQRTLLRMAPGYDNRISDKCELVPEELAGGETRLPSRITHPTED